MNIEKLLRTNRRRTSGGDDFIDLFLFGIGETADAGPIESGPSATRMRRIESRAEGEAQTFLTARIIAAGRWLKASLFSYEMAPAAFRIVSPRTRPCCGKRRLERVRLQEVAVSHLFANKTKAEHR